MKVKTRLVLGDGKMIRLTTPTHIFTFPDNVNPSEIDWLKLTYAQEGRIVLEKDLKDMSIVGQTVSVTLTQAETKMFKVKKEPVQVQMRIGIGDTAMATKIYQVSVYDVLNNEILSKEE